MRCVTTQTGSNEAKVSGIRRFGVAMLALLLMAAPAMAGNTTGQI